MPDYEMERLAVECSCGSLEASVLADLREQRSRRKEVSVPSREHGEVCCQVVTIDPRGPEAAKKMNAKLANVPNGAKVAEPKRTPTT